MAKIPPMIFPGRVWGTISPYPTVVKVTREYQSAEPGVIFSDSA